MTGLLGLPHVARARQTIAVLAFGGPGAAQIRESIVVPLGRRYEVLHGDRLLDACDTLGIPMQRGRNLARCAAQIGAVAVVGGAVAGGKLSLAVYSGKTGEPLATGKVPCRGELSQQGLRQSLIIILEGLSKAPASVGHHRPAPEPAVEPAPEPAPEPGEGKGSSLDFEPEPVGSSSEGQHADMDEDPLAAPRPSPAQVVAQKEQGEAGVTKEPAARDPWPRIAASFGLGTWTRNFELNDPALINDPKTKQRYTHPAYSSGSAFAIQLGLSARPAAFFTDKLLSWIYLALQYQQTAGLESGDSSTGDSYSTTMREFLLHLGVDWNVFRTFDIKLSPLGPLHFKAGLGFGLMDFGIDWPPEGKKVLPDVAYRFFLLKLVLSLPVYVFARGHVGAHFGFDYRAVGGSGEIEDPESWYGPSSTGGISLALGLGGSYRGFTLGLEYTYTRYFYSFTEADARVQASMRAAGGALDVQHGFIISLGYSY